MSKWHLLKRSYMLRYPSCIKIDFIARRSGHATVGAGVVVLVDCERIPNHRSATVQSMSEPKTSIILSYLGYLRPVSTSSQQSKVHVGAIAHMR